jgi:hypothetical protein
LIILPIPNLSRESIALWLHKAGKTRKYLAQLCSSLHIILLLFGQEIVSKTRSSITHAAASSGIKSLAKLSRLRSSRYIRRLPTRAGSLVVLRLSAISTHLLSECRFWRSKLVVAEGFGVWCSVDVESSDCVCTPRRVRRCAWACPLALAPLPRLLAARRGRRFRGSLSLAPPSANPTRQTFSVTSTHQSSFYSHIPLHIFALSPPPIELPTILSRHLHDYFRTYFYLITIL